MLSDLIIRIAKFWLAFGRRGVYNVYRPKKDVLVWRSSNITTDVLPKSKEEEW